MPSGEDSLERTEHFFFRFMFKELLVELKYSDSWVFVTLLERVFMCPVDVSLRILAFHPVAELFVLARQVLFQFFLVAAPISFELLLCPLHVPIDRLCFDLSYCLTLDEISFFVSSGPRHGASELGSAYVLALETHGF